MNDRRRQRSGNPAVRGGAAEPTAPAKAPAPRPQPKGSPSGGAPGGMFDDALEIPAAGLTYPQLLRVPGSAWWRSLLGVACGLALFLLLTTVINQAIVFGFWAVGSPQTPYGDYAAAAARFESPVGMLGANLGLATLIVICAVLMPLVHRVNPRWLISVESHLRGRYFAICLALGIIAPVLIQGLSTLVEGVPQFKLNDQFWLFLIVIILTSPLQAAAEEVFFRGYLLQALGSVMKTPWFGIIASSLIFALFHGVQNPALFVDRFAFGLLAAILVWRTGGLEAGIGAHIANNVLAYLLAGLTGTISATRGIREIGWENAAFDVGGFALFALLAWLIASRLKLRRTVPPSP